MTNAFEAASFADFDSLERSRVEQDLSKRFGTDIDFMFKAYWRPVTAWEAVAL